MKKLLVVLCMVMIAVFGAKDVSAATSRMDSETDGVYVDAIKWTYVPKGYKIAFYTEKQAQKEESKLRKQKKWKKLPKRYSALARSNYKKKKYTVVRVDWKITNTKKKYGKSKCGTKISYKYMVDYLLYYMDIDEYEKGQKITSYFLMKPNGDTKHELWRENHIYYDWEH